MSARAGWLLAGALCAACGPAADHGNAAAGDSGFGAVQRRGRVVMGVDQYTSTHLFQPLADGGRIELQRDADDHAGAEQIRRHMQVIARQFAEGDFRLPGVVHARDIPGTAVMAELRSAIRYEVETLPRGAALRVRSADPRAVNAIHAFLAFQRSDHHAAAYRDS